MKKIFFLLFLISNILSYSQFKDKKIYSIQKCINPPNIDGVLDDNIWKGIEIAKDFSQIEPKNGKSEKYDQRTEVKICYDNKYIYFGALMYDNCPDSILKELSKRDEQNKNFDGFGVLINPFNDGQIEYKFFISAAGVQVDAKISPTGEDVNWNTVWKSAVNINENGWSTEIAIPFSSLRFSKDSKDWALNMIRNLRRNREKYSWNPINTNYTNTSIQSGILTGINNIKSPIRLSFMPYSSIYLNKYNKTYSIPYNYGMDLKYGINESFTLDMTLIPDFGQVSTDSEILNLTPFEIKYEEKRQFFNEGTELFNIGENLFYSRRIQDDLINATKISGRTKNGLGFASLNAITNKNQEKPLTNYNVMIFDQSYGNNSSFSIMNTNMIQNGDEYDANVTGLFSRINNKKSSFSLKKSLKMSNLYTNNSSVKGYSGSISMNKTKGSFRYRLWSYFEDNEFNPNDLGYLQSNNEIKSGISLSHHQLNETKKFINSKSEFELIYSSLFDDGKGNQRFINLDLSIDTRITLKNYLSIFAKIQAFPIEGMDFYESRTNDFNNPVVTSKMYKGRLYLSTDYRKKFALDIGSTVGISPLYNGISYYTRISPRYRFNDQISLKYVLALENKYNDIGWVQNDTTQTQSRLIYGTRDVYMITNVLETSYILNNKIDLSTKLRHYWSGLKYNNEFNQLNPDGYLYSSDYTGEHDDNFNIWTIDMSLNWWFAPGSQMSIVWKNIMQEDKNVLIRNLFSNISNTFNTIPQNSFSFKIVYYLDYLYLRKK